MRVIWRKRRWVCPEPLYPVAAAVTEFLTMALVDNPHRVGKELRDDLAGIGSARRGTYRVLYRINEGATRSSSYASSTDPTSTVPLTRLGSTPATAPS